MTFQARILPTWPIVLQGIGGVTVDYDAGRATIGFDYDESELGIELADAVAAAGASETAAEAAQAAAEDAKADAEAAAAVSQAAANSTVRNLFSTKAAAIAFTPDTAPASIETAFLDTDYIAGSGTSYRDAGTSDPSVEGQIVVVAAGVNRFYIPSNRIHRPSQHGVKHGGDPGDNRLGLIEMFELANRTGNEIDMGRNGEVYEIDDTITHEFTKDSIIRGTGATVKLASAGVKLFALRFLTDAEKVDHEGFTVDANSKAPNALWYENYAASYVDADVKTIRLVGVEGSNGKRILLADYWGAGITVRGAWSHLLSRDCKSSGMIGASGSHDTAQGVMGFYFGRNSDGLYPVHKDIYNPTIDTVANEDTSMAYNMDGIHIADNLPGNDGNRERASTYISGGTFRNCWGRAIKCQGLNVDIYSPMIIQTDGPLVSGEKKSTCFVSLQYGEGAVRGLRAQCESASTISVVDGTARTFANGKMLVDGAFIQGKGTIPDIDQILYRYSDNGYTARGAASVINTQIKSVIPERFVNFYSRLNGTEQVVCNNNWSEAIGTSAILIGNDSGSNVTHVFAQGNFNGSTSKPLVATTTATATTVQSGNIGFS